MNLGTYMIVAIIKNPGETFHLPRLHWSIKSHNSWPLDARGLGDSLGYLIMKSYVTPPYYVVPYYVARL